MDVDVKTREYLKLCQKQWQWILNNYDRLIWEGCGHIWDLRGAYFDECGLYEPKERCYLCELADLECLKCPLSGIAWREDHSYPCVYDKDSVYRRIIYLFDASKDEKAKDAIKQFLSIIDNECRRC